VETAYPGDIVGLTNPGAFNLGDTVTTDPAIRYDEVPEFVPEVFARLSNMDVSKLKQFEKGIQQLCQEGLIQLFWDTRSHRREPILGAIGKLQFEVVQYRLLSEYNVKSMIEPLGYEVIRWLEADEATLKGVYWGSNALPLSDDSGAPVVLIASTFSADYLERQNPKVRFSASPASGFTALASGA
jgi:peptide chain release factor 3